MRASRERRARHGLDPGRHVRHGLGGLYPEERPVHGVAVEGFWIDERPVTVGRVPPLRGGDRLCDLAERPPDAADYPDADPELLVPGSLVFQPRRGPVDLDDYRNWWAYVPGRLLAAARGPGQRHVHARAPPGHAHRLRGRRGLRRVGGQGAADRGRVGVRGARRPRRRRVRLGRRGRAGRAADGQHLAGRVPVAEHARATATPARRPSARSRPTASGCTT